MGSQVSIGRQTVQYNVHLEVDIPGGHPVQVTNLGPWPIYYGNTQSGGTSVVGADGCPLGVGETVTFPRSLSGDGYCVGLGTGSSGQTSYASIIGQYDFS
jgi:hypothetical protein